MRVRQWMTPQPVTVTPQTSVLNARRLLSVHGIRHLPVVDGQQLVGMVSDRDLVLRDSQVVQVLSALQSELIAGRYRPIDTIMSAPVCVAQADDPVGAAAADMRRWGVSALPVVERGRLVGIITTTDCLRALRGLDPRPVGDGIGVESDPDWYKTTPMPVGDDRPGRPVDRQPAPADEAPVAMT